MGNPSLNDRIYAQDLHFMQHALHLSEQGLGRTWPNPSVGCVLVKAGRVIGAARSADGGRPHAEPQALTQAGSHAKDATAYVTLEPCAHEGSTPSCAQALIKAGVNRVVIACEDPDPRTNGKGSAALRKAGIAVTTGICEKEAIAHHAGFFSRLKDNRPFTTLKLATSLDGMIANAKGESQWITGERARNRGHLLRARHDAILTGIGTVLADDPTLTCRLPGLEAHSPVRVILDSQLRLPTSAQLVQTAKDTPVWVLTTKTGMASSHRSALEKAGIILHALPADANSHVSLEAAFTWLSEQGITRLLAEPGGKLASACYTSGLVHQLYWFRAPLAMGSDGIPALPGMLTEQAPSDVMRMTRKATIPLGTDLLEIYDRA